MTTKRKSLPLSRARREFNRLLRDIQRGEVVVYEITRNGVPMCEITRHKSNAGAWDSFFIAEEGVSDDFGLSEEDRS